MEHKTYVTFGQSHVHRVNGKTLDKDTVAVLKSAGPAEGRALAFELFGPVFSMEYPEAHWDASSLHYFPKGLVEVN